MVDGHGPRAATLRLDLFLWHARLARTRAVAQTLITTGRLRLDGRLVERSHTPVRTGSIIVYAERGRIRALRIEALPTRRGSAPEAQACYSDLTIGPDQPANVSQQAPLD